MNKLILEIFPTRKGVDSDLILQDNIPIVAKKKMLE